MSEKWYCVSQTMFSNGIKVWNGILNFRRERESGTRKERRQGRWRKVSKKSGSMKMVLKRKHYKHRQLCLENDPEAESRESSCLHHIIIFQHSGFPCFRIFRLRDTTQHWDPERERGRREIFRIQFFFRGKQEEVDGNLWQRLRKKGMEIRGFEEKNFRIRMREKFFRERNVFSFLGFHSLSLFSLFFFLLGQSGLATQKTTFVFHPSRLFFWTGLK